ncbi:MAG: putative porin [Opitutaceae bacterium]|nr:putative porin [Verrucomicrobiales bacterium]
MTTKPNYKNRVAAMAGAALLFATTGHLSAQSADALIDKLVSKGVLTVKEANDLREESDKNFTTALQTKNGMLDWVQALKFNGDVRARFESFNSDNTAFNARTRLRYRLRFGVVAQLTDSMEAGFRLTSSEPGGSFGGDPISGNTTFQNNADKKFIYLDQAYGKWSPLKGPSWIGSLTIGKMENPFVFSDMVFDGDYTPEGVAMNLGYVVNDQHSVKLNAGYFVLDELSGSTHDPSMVGAQLRWDAVWSPKLNTSIGGAYLAMCNENQITNGAVPNMNRGNTRVGATGMLAYRYTPFIVDASATYTLDKFPLFPGPFPIKVGGDFMYNNGAPGGGNDVNGRSVDNSAYSVGIQFGKSGKKGTWDLSYTWKSIGANAWWEEVTDSDFGAFYGLGNSPANSGSGSSAGYGAGTNVKGHVIKFTYSPFNSWMLSAKWFLTSLVNDYPAGANSSMSRVQVDANWKF